MVLLLSVSAFCIDGSFSNLAPYTVESYGVRLGARSSRLGQTANGVGKILGPLSIAVIAGTSNIISPQATEGALTGGFLFLAGGMALVGLSFLFLGVETHGRAMTVEAEPAMVVIAAATRQAALKAALNPENAKGVRTRSVLLRAKPGMGHDQPGTGQERSAESDLPGGPRRSHFHAAQTGHLQRGRVNRCYGCLKRVTSPAEPLT
jgi:hypothetical protein